MANNIAVTGMGGVSAIGLDIKTMSHNLRNSYGGISKISSFSTEEYTSHYAAEIKDWPAKEFFPDSYSDIDRTAQFAIVAARQAVADASLSKEELRSGRVALIFGICSGGIGSPNSPGILRTYQYAKQPEYLSKFLDTHPYVQTDLVAADLGIVGPRLTVSTACSSSASALSIAMTMLRTGKVDAVVVGGADAWSPATYGGFYSLGALATEPCSPFSRNIGVTFGEGAGCIVLESEPRARKRGVKPKAYLSGVGCTADAHHITAPDPSGAGLVRAMQLALEDASLTPSCIDYINAHGTGTNDNDITETVALHRLFDSYSVPPVSSSKSFFGHTLGSAGILEFITSVIGLREGFAPATLHFDEARSGCDLNYIPNQAVSLKIDNFISMSAAFGGINTVTVGSRAINNSDNCETTSYNSLQRKKPQAHVVVSGIGVVSPVGHGVEKFRKALNEGTTGFTPITRFNTDDLSIKVAATIENLPVRELAASADLRRADNITKFAVTASTLALKDAGLFNNIAPEKIGLIVAMTEGPSGSIEEFNENLERNGIAKLSARFFPPVVYSTVGGQICQACRIRGATFTLLDGAGVGLTALAQAKDILLQHDELDAIVVVAADEISFLSTYVKEQNGFCSNISNPFSSSAHGYVPSEGAVALVLERESTCRERNIKPWGRIAGTGMKGYAGERDGQDPNIHTLTCVASDALTEGNCGFPDMVYGLSCGLVSLDSSEAEAMATLFGNEQVFIGGVNAQLGLAEATSGLYSAVAALLGLRYGEAYPIYNLEETKKLVSGAQRLNVVRKLQHKPLNFVMAIGSNRSSNCTAVLFEGV